MPFQLLILVSGSFAMTALLSTLLATLLGGHPWLPPYGLDRVGLGTDEFQADVRFEQSPLVNPVNLGCILPPHDSLLIAPKQVVRAKFAAYSTTRDAQQSHVTATFASRPQSVMKTALPLTKGKRADADLRLPTYPDAIETDQLLLILNDGEGQELWKKTINVSFVRQSPKLTDFGATRLKLRYDARISVRLSDGSFTSLDYDKAWTPELDDVVVTLPMGGRFVFWRGSSYVPFWAGDHNTGLSYEWAETTPPKDGFADCVEPLMDKELRYGRVEILESTPVRVRVRWTYQSCDFLYKVWGDTAEEVFTFYPDGFGTRTLTIQSALDGDYELSEFIVLTPQGAYPFEVLPKNLVTLLFQDGSRHEMEFPVKQQLPEEFADLNPNKLPVLFQIRMHKDDPRRAVYFNAADRGLPPVAFAGFQDQGEVVTPCYWGSHWPLARGQTTGGAINDRIHASPSHNSALSWAKHRPKPLREETLMAIDSLGRSKPMRRQTWTWLIGLSAEDDQTLLNRAKSFSTPPGIVDLRNVRLDAETWSPERRAIRLVREGGAESMELTIEPQPVTVDPVFEIVGVATSPKSVMLGEDRLDPLDWKFADGVLWINATIASATRVRIELGSGEGDRPCPK
jgi:hypothetical protein